MRGGTGGTHQEQLSPFLDPLRSQRKKGEAEEIAPLLHRVKKLSAEKTTTFPQKSENGLIVVPAAEKRGGGRHSTLNTLQRQNAAHFSCHEYFLAVSNSLAIDPSKELFQGSVERGAIF